MSLKVNYFKHLKKTADTKEIKELHRKYNNITHIKNINKNIAITTLTTLLKTITMIFIMKVSKRVIRLKIKSISDVWVLPGENNPYRDDNNITAKDKTVTTSSKTLLINWSRVAKDFRKRTTTTWNKYSTEDVNPTNFDKPIKIIAIIDKVEKW